MNRQTKQASPVLSGARGLARRPLAPHPYSPAQKQRERD